ncbi:MAG TPA: HNH endonuclease signature motif containing protein [Ornithinicoccus sp.]|nr:HNH endonuclease signature motif containing protein [Ornithinicoccus sp.]
MGAEEYLEQVLVRADYHDLTRARLSLVPAGAVPLDPVRLREARRRAVRLDRLAGVLPGLPADALGLLLEVSDAADPQRTHTTVPGTGAHPGGDGPGAGSLAEVAARGQTFLAGAQATVTLARVLEGVQLDLLAAMATTVAAELLAREHATTDPGELSRTARARWRSRTKSVVAQEFAAVSGFGIQDCHDRVGFALAPAPARQPGRAALREGRADWWQVWQWFKRCRNLPPETAADIAGAVFPTPTPTTGPDNTTGPDGHGPDNDTDPDGDGTDPGPTDQATPDAAPAPAGLSRRGFMNLLDRETTRAVGQDPVTARAARAAAVANRRVRVVVDADGTGCLTLTGRACTVVAAADRIDTAARKARAAGDTRTLDQLRSDTALALLTTATLPDPTAPTTSTTCSDATGPDDGTGAGGDHPRPSGVNPGQAGPSGTTDGGDRLDPASGGGWDRATVDRLTAVLAGLVPASVEVVVPFDVLTGTNPHGVALLTGHGHLTGEHAREVALVPGSTLHRLVTDPATGTLTDRSTDRYVPDEAMRAVITAADRYCRAPGCTRPATTGQLDHVTPYPAGPTAITNLVALHTAHHNTKTNTWWNTLIDPATRVLTWTSFYHRTFTTTPFDYRTLTGPPPRTREADGDGGPPDRTGHTTACHPADLADQLLYAALAHRDPGDTLATPDEEEDPTTHLWARRSTTLTLTHTSPTGKTLPGAPPRHPTPAELLNRRQDHHPVTNPHTDHVTPRGQDPHGHLGPAATAMTPDDDEEPPPF